MFFVVVIIIIIIIIIIITTDSANMHSVALDNRLLGWAAATL